MLTLSSLLVVVGDGSVAGVSVRWRRVRGLRVTVPLLVWLASSEG